MSRSATPTAFFQNAPIISDQIDAAGLGVVWRELGRVLQSGVAGDVVEFGCYIGTASLFLRRQLDAYDQSAGRALHVYDSFAGLPSKTAADASPAGLDFTAGALRVSQKDLRRVFHQANLRSPVVHKAWFNELQAADVPERIAFAFLDGDFYESIRDSLRLVWPRLQPGGCVVVDDYQRAALPGVDRALAEFFRGSNQAIRSEAGRAVIRL